MSAMAPNLICNQKETCPFINNNYQIIYASLL